MYQPRLEFHHARRAAAYVAGVLYEATHERSYLDQALRLVRWADSHLHNGVSGLYGRNTSDGTTMDYVQGMMIGAELELCHATLDQRYCREAERVGAASLATFPSQLDWSATADGLYLRFLLDLYHEDGNPRWYRAAIANANHARVRAASGDGLYLRGWNGETIPGGRLRTHAGTVALFAWVAAAQAHHA